MLQTETIVGDLLTSPAGPTQASVHHCVVMPLAVELSLKQNSESRRRIMTFLLLLIFYFLLAHVITKKAMNILTSLMKCLYCRLCKFHLQYAGCNKLVLIVFFKYKIIISTKQVKKKGIKIEERKASVA